MSRSRALGSSSRNYKHSFVVRNSNVRVRDSDFRVLGSWFVTSESDSDQKFTTAQIMNSGGDVTYANCTFIDIQGSLETAGTNHFRSLSSLNISRCLFENCANTNTNVWKWYGSGLFCEFNAPIYLTDTVFKRFVHLYSTSVCHLQAYLIDTSMDLYTTPPVITGCTFENIRTFSRYDRNGTSSNWKQESGGCGLAVRFAQSITLTDCTFNDTASGVSETAGNDGGAVWLNNQVSSTADYSIRGCTFIVNKAMNAGACIELAQSCNKLEIVECRFEHPGLKQGSGHGLAINLGSSFASLTIESCSFNECGESSSSSVISITAVSEVNVSSTNFSHCTIACIRGVNVGEFRLSHCHFESDSTVRDDQESISITGSTCNANIISCCFESATPDKLEISFEPDSGSISFNRDCCFSSRSDAALHIVSESIVVVLESDNIFQCRRCLSPTMSFSAFDDLTESQPFTSSNISPESSSFLEIEGSTYATPFTDEALTTISDSVLRSDNKVSVRSSETLGFASTAGHVVSSVVVSKVNRTATVEGAKQPKAGLTIGQIVGIASGAVILVAVVIIVVVTIVKKRHDKSWTQGAQFPDELQEEQTMESVIETMTDSTTTEDVQLWLRNPDRTEEHDPLDDEDSDALRFNHVLFEEQCWD